MIRASPRTVFASLTLAFAVACAATEPAGPAKKLSARKPIDHAHPFASLHALTHPLPTEGGMIERVERDKQGRLEWIERMHRAADGVDWRAIEAENQRREEQRRVRMAQQQGQHPGITTADWGEVGSRNQCGRIHCVARLHGGTSAEPIWIGADLGGVWRGNANGTGWLPKSDNVYGGAAHVIVVPTDIPGGPDVVLQATDGGRVRVSRDDGLTWTTPGGLPASLSSCRGLGVLTDTAGTILLYGQFNSGGTRPGVFASTDRHHLVGVLARALLLQPPAGADHREHAQHGRQAGAERDQPRQAAVQRHRRERSPTGDS